MTDTQKPTDIVIIKVCDIEIAMSKKAYKDYLKRMAGK